MEVDTEYLMSLLEGLSLLWVIWRCQITRVELCL